MTTPADAAQALECIADVSALNSGRTVHLTSREETTLRAAATVLKQVTHCDKCGCDWLDNGLNPLGCPYCTLPANW
jgi:predicted Zn-ribbon and HTH transcriptional regulator